jgi:hypothetical protein
MTNVTINLLLLFPVFPKKSPNLLYVRFQKAASCSSEKCRLFQMKYPSTVHDNFSWLQGKKEFFSFYIGLT